jgi:hypothetical protein
MDKDFILYNKKLCKLLRKAGIDIPAYIASIALSEVSDELAISAPLTAHKPKEIANLVFNRILSLSGLQVA